MNENGSTLWAELSFVTIECPPLCIPFKRCYGAVIGRGATDWQKAGRLRPDRNSESSRSARYLHMGPLSNPLRTWSTQITKDSFGTEIWTVAECAVNFCSSPFAAARMPVTTVRSCYGTDILRCVPERQKWVCPAAQKTKKLPFGGISWPTSGKGSIADAIAPNPQRQLRPRSSRSPQDDERRLHLG